MRLFAVDMKQRLSVIDYLSLDRRVFSVWKLIIFYPRQASDKLLPLKMEFYDWLFTKSWSLQAINL